jgi:ornithine carbamoyltransferase
MDIPLPSLPSPSPTPPFCIACPPGEEVTADIIDGQHSVVFDEMENRLHAHKTVTALLMK